VASAAPRRVASRPRGVYTPPRWEQIGSTPATIYPRVLGQLPSCAGLGVRRCNRTMRGVPCCNRSRKRPAPRRKGSHRQSVEWREASGWAQPRCRAAQGDDEVGAVCRGLRTSLGGCMRCAQSAAGESPPNPKVQHVHYDTGPQSTRKPPGARLRGALVRNARCFRFRKISRTQDALRTARPGPWACFQDRSTSVPTAAQWKISAAVEDVCPRAPHRAPASSGEGGGRPEGKA